MPPPTPKPDPARILIEDALKHLLDCGLAGRAGTLESLAGALGIDRVAAGALLDKLHARKLTRPHGDTHPLSDEGRAYALRVLRTHRLYETWLARETGTPAENWHRLAHNAEHTLDPTQAEALAASLGDPRFDPHGDPIPTRDGKLPPDAPTPLRDWPDGMAAVIAHIEDEPESLYTELLSLQLAPGTRIDQPQRTADGSSSITRDGRRVTIPSHLTGMVHLQPAATASGPARPTLCLADLPLGAVAEIAGLSPSCTGAERLRLLDLGIVPGTPIRSELSAPFNGPRAFIVRGAMIALRRAQQERVLIHPAT